MHFSDFLWYLKSRWREDWWKRETGYYFQKAPILYCLSYLLCYCYTLSVACSMATSWGPTNFTSPHPPIFPRNQFRSCVQGLNYFSWIEAESRAGWEPNAYDYPNAGKLLYDPLGGDPLISFRGRRRGQRQRQHCQHSRMAVDLNASVFEDSNVMMIQDRLIPRTIPQKDIATQGAGKAHLITVLGKNTQKVWPISRRKCNAPWIISRAPWWHLQLTAGPTNVCVTTPIPWYDWLTSL